MLFLFEVLWGWAGRCLAWTGPLLLVGPEEASSVGSVVAITPTLHLLVVGCGDLQACVRQGSFHLPLLQMRRPRPGERLPWSPPRDGGSEQEKTLAVLTLGLVLSDAGRPVWGSESSGNRGAPPPQLPPSVSSVSGGEPRLAAPGGGPGRPPTARSCFGWS